jgi:hypothetical protein
MKDLWEPIELTQSELDAVAGGNPFISIISTPITHITTRILPPDGSGNSVRTSINNDVIVNGVPLTM